MDTSYLAQQVNTIIGQLHGLFDEIGVPNHDRDAREEEVRDITWYIATDSSAGWLKAVAAAAVAPSVCTDKYPHGSSSQPYPMPCKTKSAL